MWWIMQQDKTKIAILWWHSSTRFKNGLKWLQITSQNIPVEQTSSSLHYLLFPFGNRWGGGVHLKFTLTVTLFQNKREKDECMCVCAVCPQAVASTVLEAAAGENADY